MTQIGGNMVLYGLTVRVFSLTHSTSAVSLLILTFLVPAVLLSAVAGVYVDRLDRRLILIVTNLLRAIMFGVLFLVGDNLALILVLNAAISTVTTFFAPAEAAMIPVLVKRGQLLAANGVFTLTLNAAFALGFALLGPLVVNLTSPQVLVLVVAGCYLLAMVLTITLPSASPAAVDHPHGLAVKEASVAVESTFGQLREGVAFIRGHRSITWSLVYLGITASLIGVLGVVGPSFATEALGLSAKDFVVIVLPLGVGVVTGILLLNTYGRVLSRRRTIEIRPDPAGHLPGDPVGGRAGDPLPAARHLRLADRRLVAGDPPVGGDRAGLPGRDRLCQRRDHGPDPAPGGPARRGPRAGLRRAQHADLHGQLPADHHLRPDRRPDLDDRGRLRGGDCHLSLGDPVGRRPAQPGRQLTGRGSMSRIAVVFTGGTISMVVDPLAGGAIPALDGAAILARTPGLAAIAEVVPVERG